MTNALLTDWTCCYTLITSGGRDCKFSVNSGDVATAYSLCEKLLYLECNNKFQLATLLAIC